MNIIGLRIEKYIDKEISGHNTDFEYKDAEFEKHIICGVLDDNRKVEIELSHSEGECYSGWTIASWGHIEVTEVKKFNGYTFIPKQPLIVEDIEPKFKGDISNDVFSVRVSERALIIRLPMEGSFAQNGTRPQRNMTTSRVLTSLTAATAWVGATL